MTGMAEKEENLDTPTEEKTPEGLTVEEMPVNLAMEEMLGMAEKQENLETLTEEETLVDWTGKEFAFLVVKQETLRLVWA